MGLLGALTGTCSISFNWYPTYLFQAVKRSFMSPAPATSIEARVC